MALIKYTDVTSPDQSPIKNTVGNNDHLMVLSKDIDQNDILIRVKASDLFNVAAVEIGIDGIPGLSDEIAGLKTQDQIIQGSVAGAEQDIIDAESRLLTELSNKQQLIDDANALINSVEGRVTINETSITQNENEILLRATQTEVNAIDGRVSNAETAISQNANEISLRAFQSEVDLINNEVSYNSAQITINADAITTKVSQVVFDALDDQVNGAGGLNDRVTVNETSITQTAKQIKLLAYELDVVAQGSERQVRSNKAFIDINSQQIQLKVSQTEYDSFVNTVQTDYATIVLTDQKIANTVASINYTGLITGSISTFNNTSKVLTDSTATFQTDGVIAGYIVSVTMASGLVQVFTIESVDSETQLTLIDGGQDNLVGNEAYKISSIMYAASSQFVQTANSIETKVEQTVFNDLDQQVGTNTTNITQNADAILLRVLQSEFDPVAGQVSTNETNISQNATDISLRVLQTEFDPVSGQVTTNTSDISANATAITLRVLQTEFDPVANQVTTNVSEIEQRLNEIKLAVYELDAIGQGSEQEVRRSQASIQILQDQIITKVGNDEIFSQMTQTAEGFEYAANYMKSANFNGTIVDGVITVPGTVGWAKDKNGAISMAKGYVGGEGLSGANWLIDNDSWVHPSLGGPITVQTKQLPYGTVTSNVGSFSSEWDTPASTSTSLTVDSSAKVRRYKYTHQFGMNKMMMNVIAKASTQSFAGTAHVAEIRLIVNGVSYSVPVSTSTATYAQYTIEADISGLIDGTLYDVVVETYAEVTGNGVDLAETRTFLREDMVPIISTESV